MGSSFGAAAVRSASGVRMPPMNSMSSTAFRRFHIPGDKGFRWFRTGINFLDWGEGEAVWEPKTDDLSALRINNGSA